jgi:hypothetical protein
MNSSSFDLSTVIDPVVEAIRLRLPELVSAEVKRQLSASPVTKEKLSDTELRQRNALRAQAGLPLLPGVGMPAGRIDNARESVQARIAAIRARRP